MWWKNQEDAKNEIIKTPGFIKAEFSNQKGYLILWLDTREQFKNKAYCVFESAVNSAGSSEFKTYEAARDHFQERVKALMFSND